jgi:hypothetical protein
MNQLTIHREQMESEIPADKRRVPRLHLYHVTSHRTTHLFVFVISFRYPQPSVNFGLNITISENETDLNITASYMLVAREAPRFWLRSLNHGIRWRCTCRRAVHCGIFCNSQRHLLVIIFPSLPVMKVTRIA